MGINKENFIDKLKRQDEKAIDYLVDEYGALIKAIVTKHLYNLDAFHDECINDILLAVWNNANKFSGEHSKFKSWVAAISKYKAIDYKRKYLLNLNNKNIDQINLSIEDNSLNGLLEVELRQEIEELLKNLNEQDRDIFKSIYLNDISVNDVSKRLGLSRNVIYNRISRGKKRLRAIFAK